MPNGIVPVPDPINEPVRAYAPGSPQKASLKARIDELLKQEIEIPLVIGGKEVRTGKLADAVCPHDHRHVLGRYHMAGEKEVEQAIKASQKAWAEWSEMPWEHRAAVLLKAAELLAGPWRDTLNAACMLNQSKTVYQAEIDAACELIDFFRFNPYYMRFIYEQQPGSQLGHWDYVEYRALEGFVFAITPFNFASIAGNPVLASPHFAGVHFTGSTAVFHGMWKTIGENIARYRTYPRIVGETGGKDFVFAHPSADVEALATALVRGAFEYQGQKCSAASRAYIPRSIWPQLKKLLVGQISEIKVGPPTDFRNFMCAVIDRGAFNEITGFIRYAKRSSDAKIRAGGTWDDSEGYFIQPTVVESTDPYFKLMEEEIFGPVLTVYVYDDKDLAGALKLCDTTSPYALTGAIFAQDRAAAVKMANRLRHAAGNFYINDKPTGAVVGQQPFGGSRASGTNDKAGSYLNLIRWTSQRTIKENFVPPKHFAYPFMGEE